MVKFTIHQVAPLRHSATDNRSIKCNQFLLCLLSKPLVFIHSLLAFPSDPWNCAKMWVVSRRKGKRLKKHDLDFKLSHHQWCNEKCAYGNSSS